MPYVPYQFLTAGQKARLGGNRRRTWNSRGRRRTWNRGGSYGFSGSRSNYSNGGRRKTRRSASSAYFYDR